MEAKKGRISIKRRLEEKTSVRNDPIAFGERVSTAEAATLRHEMETQGGLIDCARTKDREGLKNTTASPSPSDVDPHISIRRTRPHTQTAFFCRCTGVGRKTKTEGNRHFVHTLSHSTQDRTGTSVSVNPFFRPSVCCPLFPSLFFCFRFYPFPRGLGLLLLCIVYHHSLLFI